MHDEVAPYVGAWIETVGEYGETTFRPSHPMWVRGLKLAKSDVDKETRESHPMWVRGLKHLKYLL